MILEAMVGVITPMAIGAIYKAIRVEKSVEDLEEDVKYIRDRVDTIMEHLLETKR